MCYLLCAFLHMQFKPDVEVTELALAFPISPDLSNITLAKVHLKDIHVTN